MVWLAQGCHLLALSLLPLSFFHFPATALLGKRQSGKGKRRAQIEGKGLERKKAQLAIKNMHMGCSAHDFYPLYIPNFSWQTWHHTQMQSLAQEVHPRCSDVLTKGLMKEQQMKKRKTLLLVSIKKILVPGNLEAVYSINLAGHMQVTVTVQLDLGADPLNLCHSTQNQAFNETFQLCSEAIFYHPV